MVPGKPSSLRIVLSLLLVAAALPAAALVALWGWHERRDALSRVGEAAELDASLIASELTAQIAGTRELLAQLALPGAADPVAYACGKIAAHARSAFSQAMGVLDAQGRLVCSEPRSSRPERRGPFLDAAWFQAARSAPYPLVRDVATGIVVPSPTVAGLARLEGPSGFAGLAFGTVAVKRVSEVVTEVKMPAGSSVSVLGPDLQVVARAPPLLGRYSHGRFLRARDAEVVRVLQARVASNREMRGRFEAGDLDGKRRAFGYRILPGLGVTAAERRAEPAGYVLVGLELGPELEAGMRRILMGLLGVSVAGILGCVVAWVGVDSLVLRDVRATTQTIELWRQGDREARVGPTSGARELQQLSRAFDEMADSLEHGLGHSAQALETLRRAKETLHGLARRLLLDQEAERRGLARELHDELGQDLTAIGLALDVALRKGVPAPARARIEAAREGVKMTLGLVRRMSLDLHPQVLEDLGLGAAIRAYASRLAEAGDVSIDVHVDDQAARVPGEIEAAGFRIAQEALTNVVRHSGAKHAEVAVERSEATLAVSIRDDGHGFDVARAADGDRPRASLGLLGMEERAALVGGRLEIRSSPAGTTVRAEFPLSSETLPGRAVA